MRWLFVLLALALPVAAQDETAPLTDETAIVTDDAVDEPEFTASTGASLRFLDKLTSETGDVTLTIGQTAKFGRLIVQLNDCRYPTANPASDAEAHLKITDEQTTAVLFNGWMLASAPALSALDHPRYDVWVLSCDLPEANSAEATSEGEGE